MLGREHGKSGRGHEMPYRLELTDLDRARLESLAIAPELPLGYRETVLKVLKEPQRMQSDRAWEEWTR